MKPRIKYPLLGMVTAFVLVMTLWFIRVLMTFSRDTVIFADHLVGQRPEIAATVRWVINMSEVLAPYIAEYLIFTMKQVATSILNSWITPVALLIGIVLPWILMRIFGRRANNHPPS